MNRGSTLFLIVTATLGYAFLYGPILVLIVYSFNESPLVTVWQGLTTRMVRRSLARSSDSDSSNT